jgi:hypothetical protein
MRLLEKRVITPSGSESKYNLLYFYYVKVITYFNIPYSVANRLGVSRNIYITIKHSR